MHNYIVPLFLRTKHIFLSFTRQYKSKLSTSIKNIYAHTNKTGGKSMIYYLKGLISDQILSWILTFSWKKNISFTQFHSDPHCVRPLKITQCKPALKLWISSYTIPMTLLSWYSATLRKFKYLPSIVKYFWKQVNNEVCH